MGPNKNEINIDKNIDFNKISLNIKRGVYKCIGVGSGRKVYDLSNGYVVKAAKNKKGIGQNEAEYKISLADDTNLFAKVTGVSDRFTLLVMEKSDKIKHISYVWNYFNVRSNKQLYRIKELQDISTRYSLLLIDFGRPANWGQLNGNPVIIDYGYTKEVRRRFYMPPFFRILRR